MVERTDSEGQGSTADCSAVAKNPCKCEATEVPFPLIVSARKQFLLLNGYLFYLPDMLCDHTDLIDR